jgi:hypothetical protein
MLETRQGGWTQAGPIYSCAWIAAHPVEATKARVSCNANGDNGTTPRQVPEQPPTLDPALAGFVDRYRFALASGQAKRTGAGEVDGHDVVWLQFDLPVSAPAGQAMTERVAVDAQTYKPLLVQAEQDGSSYRVSTIETAPYKASLFTKPQQVQAPTIGDVASETEVTPQQAAVTLGGTALWLGQSWNGLKLIATTHQRLTIAHAPLSSRSPAQADGIEFTYAPVAGDGSVDTHARVLIREATSCVIGYGWTCTPRDPSAEGTLELFGPISVLRRDGLYIAIWNWRSPQQPAALDMARALQPFTSG